MIPTATRQIAFESYPDCSESSFSILLKILRSRDCGEFRFYWLANDPAEAKRVIRSECPDLACRSIGIVSKNSLRGRWIFFRSKYVFSSHKTYRYAAPGKNQVLVNLLHGMPIKNLGNYDATSGPWAPSSVYSVATSDFFRGIVAQAFSLDPHRVLVTGLPRNEWLFEVDVQYWAMREGAARLVVWLPTFRRCANEELVRDDTETDAEDPISVERLMEIDHALDSCGTLVIVKLHPLDVKNDREWPPLRNIRIITMTQANAERLNVYKLLACADALVTDYSSVAIDFLLLRRPIGFYTPDSGFYRRGLIEAVQLRLAVIGVKLASPNDLVAFLRSPGNLQGDEDKIEELCASELRSPSSDVLRGVGLERLT